MGKPPPSLLYRALAPGSALGAAADAVLAVALQPLLQAHPGLTGVMLLPDGYDAFAARATLADAAQHSLDLRYFIWRQDTTGTLLLQAARRAADRGVRVRLLLDDINSADVEQSLRELAAHPCVQVRLFNPFRHRRWRWLDFVTDFGRVNRRMHNKSFTVDGQITVVGGRNIGDEYFGAGAGTLFVDLDVLAVGAVVPEVERDFEQYWSSASSYPLEQIAGTPPASEPVSEAAGFEAAAQDYREAVRESTFMRELAAQELRFEWARVVMLSDDPAKGLGRAGEEDVMWTPLEAVLGSAARELALVSPYFVPAGRGTELLTALARRGVCVSVLTNALEATDVPAVHSGYAPSRKPLLEAGAKLFELKRTFAPTRQAARGGSSGASLHAKTFIVDRARLFVGSFNFDPRSARLNTEMGFVIESPAMATAVADRLAQRLPASAYCVRLADGRLRWDEVLPDGPRSYDSEPRAGFTLRLQVWFCSLLPGQGLL